MDVWLHEGQSPCPPCCLRVNCTDIHLPTHISMTELVVAGHEHWGAQQIREEKAREIFRSEGGGRPRQRRPPQCALSPAFSTHVLSPPFLSPVSALDSKFPMEAASCLSSLPILHLSLLALVSDSVFESVCCLKQNFLKHVVLSLCMQMFPKTKDCAEAQCPCLWGVSDKHLMRE